MSTCAHNENRSECSKTKDNISAAFTLPFLSKESLVINIDKTNQYLSQQKSLLIREVYIYLDY